MYCAHELREALGERIIVQANRTATVRAGTVRGMHFQRPPHAEAKLVACIRGRVLDVALDLRRGSPTFLRWHAEELSEDNGVSLLIPEGCAHGFQSLEDGVEMLYFHTAAHVPSAEGGVDALDPRLGIPWPLAVVNRSPRDASHPAIDAHFEGL
jgi:dTDP-4-dehydrorhamnose 3,5-epimerase